MKKRILSGFCENNQHEATQPKSKSGTPMPVCLMWETCGCSCHEKITLIYDTVKLPREEPEQNPEFSAWAKAQRAQFVIPSPGDIPDLAPLSNIDGVMTPLADEEALGGQRDAALGTIPAMIKPTGQPRFSPTPTGRRARGQLEYEVLTVCQDYIKEVYEWEICSPKLVAERIGKLHGIEPPSTGAIDAVWDRWEKIGFAKRDRKPSRFVEFQGDSSAVTLDHIKAQQRRAKKRMTAEQKRGSLRPKR